MTLLFGYVTASICLQPIQPGLKKSRKICLFSFLALAKAAFMSVSHTILFAIVIPPFLTFFPHSLSFWVPFLQKPI
jgi:hypothetical protein